MHAAGASFSIFEFGEWYKVPRVNIDATNKFVFFPVTDDNTQQKQWM
jgi:hypothetical protein